MTTTRKCAHNGVAGNYILQSLASESRPFPSLNPSDDLHERSREAENVCSKMRRIWRPLNILTRYPSVHARERESSTSHYNRVEITCGPFNERAEILLLFGQRLVSFHKDD